MPSFSFFRFSVSFCALVLLALVWTVGAPASAQTNTNTAGSQSEFIPTLRISTENTESHVQTRVVAMFAERLNERLEGRLRVEHHHSAQLFRDRNVIQAIAEGKVEMAVPGTWQLDRFEPNVGIFLLPMFYGRDAAINYKLRDGEIGQAINRQIGETMGVKVIGRWIDLGYAHLYSVDQPIDSHGDLNGMPIRIPGGDANAARLEALGAVPTVIPWPDLPQALQHGTVQGVLTTHATVVSAALWEQGIRHAFEDKQYFPQYVPMISRRFWNRLDEDVRTAILQTWESVVDEGRAMARVAQKEAVQTLRENGVTIVTPSSDALSKQRASMLERQPELVRKMQINPVLVEQVRKQLEN